MIDPALVRQHRARGLNPDNPFIRGTAQNPDVYFQARETVNPFYARLPAIVQERMDAFAALTGRSYRLFDYYGAEDAERVAVVIGSAAQTFRETVAYLRRKGEKCGVINVRLCLPFSAEHFLAALPASVKAIAVLDRTKLPGSTGEPLYTDVVTVMAEALADGTLPGGTLPRIIGGRYGLSSKEFTPAMARAVLDELKKDAPKNHFTVGINDDVSHTSLDYDPSFDIEPDEVMRALFIGLGADGTVGANKNSIKIIGESTPLHAQGYFVYDSKKSGSQTVSHMRFGPNPINSPYLIRSAGFIGCHQFNFIEKMDVLESARQGAILLLNSPYGPDEVWDHLPRSAQEQIIEKQIQLYVIDASSVARETGMGGRTNTIMQTCFFAISGVLSREEAIGKIKESIRKTYGKKGEEVVQKNFDAVDQTLAHLYRVEIPRQADSSIEMPPVVPPEAPEFVQRVTAVMMAGKGDQLPVSALPIDGTYPSGTTRWEKRNIAAFVPVWEPDICIQCGNCSFVCPHSVIRGKFYPESLLASAPEGFQSAPINGRGFPETRYTLQVYLEDCTGCGLCVEVCPAKSLQHSGVKAINMKPKDAILAQGRQSVGFFERIPVNDRSQVDFSSVRGTQFLEPLFEFSGACAGCGETPYVRLLSQLFGDRAIIANATGCSSIYGGNLPATPWTRNVEGRGPAWSNSLFEDNAEFGLGFRLSADKHLAIARQLAQELKGQLDPTLVDEILDAPQIAESQIREQRWRVAQAQGGADEARQREGPRPAVGGRSSGPAQRLDRRRRWLGLRHRLLGAGPRTGQRQEHQCAGAGHGSLFQHRWPDVEVDAAGGRGQVRRRGQAGGQEGSRAAGHLLRQCVRRAGRHGRQSAADAARAARGGGVSRTFPGAGLQPLYRPRHQHAAWLAAAGSGGREWSLAADSLQSGLAAGRQKSLRARLATSDGQAQGLRVE